MFMNATTLRAFATVGIATLAQTALAQSPGSPPPGGSLSLPRPDFHFKGQVGRTYQDSDPATFPQIVRPPKGAPNIVLILLDDVGFGQFSIFGGGVASPNMEKLAAQGLRYNRFHTTALCSPTRAALLTGRDHHVAGTGAITAKATRYDGYTGIIPKSAGTVAEILRQNGYATAWSARTTTRPLGKRAKLDRLTDGPMVWASTISMVSMPATRASTSQSFMKTTIAYPGRLIPTTTCLPTLPTIPSRGCRR